MLLRIATWNINRAKIALRHGAMRTAMKDVEAHIWILTETRDSISPGPGYHRVAQSLENRRGLNDERWVSIWTNLPQGSSLETRDDEFAACAVFKRPVGTTLAVYGTVLPWRGSTWRGHESSKARAYAAALNEQSTDWSELRREYGLVCVAGDFNQALSQPFYYWSNAAEKLLRDALTTNELSARTGGLLDPVRGISSKKAACIDHICISEMLVSRQHENAHAQSPKVDDKPLSDHPIVWLDLAGA